MRCDREVSAAQVGRWMVSEYLRDDDKDVLGKHFQDVPITTVDRMNTWLIEIRFEWLKLWLCVRM